MKRVAGLAVLGAAAAMSAGTASARTTHHCTIRPPVSPKWGFIARNLTETGIAANDPHGSPCHIARWLTYYAERQNGLPGTLNLDPDGQAWSTRKHALPGNAVRDTFTHRTEHVSVTLINPMSLKDAKKWAQQTLNDFEAGAHPDPC